MAPEAIELYCMDAKLKTTPRGVPNCTYPIASAAFSIFFLISSVQRLPMLPAWV